MILDLNKNDRICFLGDSITAGGFWIREIYEHFIKFYPELKIGLFNCGISGSSGKDFKRHKRQYFDFLNYFPKYAVINFGMNDVYPQAYYPEYELENKEEIKKERLNMYEGTLEYFIEICEEADVIPILCSPTPYDEYNDYERENWKSDVALLHCHDVAERVAKKHNLIFVDLRKPIMENLDKRLCEDRVHPNEEGHHLMAIEFLKTIDPEKALERYEITPKNQERFEVERLVRRLMFIERNCIVDIPGIYEKTIEEKKEILRERLKTVDNPWTKDVAQLYFEYADKQELLKSKLIELMYEIYK